MKTRKQPVKRNTIGWLLCGILLAIYGCATTNTMPIFAHTPAAPPALSGKTVAVLPPAAVGSEAKIAIETEQIMDAVFAGDIAGVHFTNGNSHLPLLQQQPEAVTKLYRQMTSGLPTHFKQVKTDEQDNSAESSSEKNAKKPDLFVKGTSKLLLDSDTVAGVKRDGSYHVTINLADSASSLAPVQLDPVLLGSFGTDYVLISVPFGYYEKTKHTVALFGILPVGGSGAMWRSSRGLFALYESKSGQKVWESQLGTETNSNMEMIRGQLPGVSHIVVGAAYLLTGDTETSLARILSVTTTAK